MQNHTYFDKQGQEKENVVFCKNVTGFVDFIHEFIGISPNECDHLIGMDEGKGRLTLMYYCIPKNQD